jgi:mono/diheme cytochrome c family protein
MMSKLHCGRTLWRRFCMAGAVCALGQAAQAQTQSAIVNGQAIAERACAGCHTIDGSAGSTIQGTAVPSFRAIAGRGWTAERLEAFIVTPHRPMPATPLPLSEVRDLVAYIQSLR